MTARRPHLRTLTAVAMGLAAASVLGACASSSGTPDTPGPTVDAAGDTGTADAFPVTITSSLGEAVIEAKPERVVTLGWGAADIALSLGTVPVGIEEDTWGGDEEGYQPWFREAVEAQGADLPQTIAMYPELDIDAIVALEPDLVLAPQSGLDQAVFDQLSAFVPVVAAPGDPWETTIEDQITIAAEALGVPEQAADLIAEREAVLSDAASAHPELAGRSFAYVYAGTEPGSLVLYLPGDPRVELLEALGLELDPAVADVESSPGTFTATLGLENADVLDDVDLLFTWFNDSTEQAATEAQPLFAQIPAFVNGAYVPMLDPQLGMAVSVATPLSIPWAIDAYLPLITEAAAKVS
jgi:iron complex transport system substrate-binding protein